MKSYTVTPAGFAQIVDSYKDLVDVIYIVDSAGHMLPSELRNYIDAIHERVGMVTLGYHGHNNLGLGVANALELIDAGVEYIDTTLTGIGRSGGNVPTETMIAVLGKKFGVTQFSDEFLLFTMVVARNFRDYILSKGKNFKMMMDPTSGVFYLIYNNRKYHLWTILDILGVKDDELVKAWSADILDKNKQSSARTSESELNSIYFIIYEIGRAHV